MIDEPSASGLQPIPGGKNRGESVTNKLGSQESGKFSQTFTFGQGKRKDAAHDSGFAINSVDDCIRGYFPRARSGGSIKTRVERVSKRYHSDSAVTKCEKLPSVGCQLSANNNQSFNESKTAIQQRTSLACFRPWSKTSIELQKYKDSLQNCKY
ncbi:unnamed protein product, partial [Mesorhabditis belari]|uniref:Uncharacterized protein n=1 Tax=Mesorhabditis belari TaxID=2138241 RepID=A0AAF3F1E7_9BILA